jgi:5-methylcytosine-specific restriction endonuclease McrA
MTKFEKQYRLQGGRCFWCQYLTPAVKMTRDHLHPRKGGQRSRHGGDWILACAICNRARGALTIGSRRFDKWLRRVIERQDVRPFVRRDHFKKQFVHNAT